MKGGNFSIQRYYVPKFDPIGKELSNRFSEHEYDRTPKASKDPVDLDDPYNCYLRACSYEKKGDFDNALIEFQKSVQPGQKTPNFNCLLGVFYTGMAQRMTDKESATYSETLDNALRYLKEAEQIQEKYDRSKYPERTFNSIADVYSLKRDNKMAHAYYNKGIEKNTKDWYGYNGKGELYQSEGEFEEALSCFTKAQECLLKKIEADKESKDEKIAERDEILDRLKEKIAECIEVSASKLAKEFAKI